MRAARSGSPTWRWGIYSQLIGFRRGGVQSQDHVDPSVPSMCSEFHQLVLTQCCSPSTVGSPSGGAGGASCGDRPPPLGVNMATERDSGRRAV